MPPPALQGPCAEPKSFADMIDEEVRSFSLHGSVLLLDALVYCALPGRKSDGRVAVSLCRGRWKVLGAEPAAYREVAIVVFAVCQVKPLRWS